MMNRRAFLSAIPDAISQTCRRLVPGVRRAAWLARIFGAEGGSAPKDQRVVELDESRCPACGGAACDCVQLTTD